MYFGEVSKWRSLIIPFAVGDGIDVGYGGFSLSLRSINIDLPNKYSHGSDPQHLKGDARNLFWFNNEVLDYVFSSHVLEDFGSEEKGLVLREWWRVIKPSGHLILLLPDEKRYRECCLKAGSGRNSNHKDPEFGLRKCLELVIELPGVMIIKKQELFTLPDREMDYNFLIVARKK